MLAALLLGAAPPDGRLDAVQPNTAIQHELVAIAASKDQADLDRGLNRLRKLSSDPTVLMPQLVYFSMHAGDVREGMAAGAVLRGLGITREQQLAGIAPYLSASDERLSRELRNYLGNLDESSAVRPPDFHHYAPLLRAHSSEPPPVLVQYMLETAPDEGLEVLAEVYVADTARRQAFAAAHSDAASLAVLGADEAWWVRLYVAERLRQNPALRTPTLLRKLKVDSNPLVRDAIAQQ